MLAAAGTRLDGGVQPCGCGLAPSPQLGAGLLETATELWEGRGAAGMQMAGKVQCGRPSHLGRAGVRERTHTPAGLGRTYLPRNLGQCAVPGPLPASGWNAPVPSPDARMVSRHRRSCCTLRLGLPLEALVLC